MFDGSMREHHIDDPFADLTEPNGFHQRVRVAGVLPYSVRDVAFHHGGITLAGSLLVPKTPGKHAGVVLLHGSGPRAGKWGTPRYIADRFARAGIAALIYDKRGSGGSNGNLDSFTYEDLAGDAVAGVRFLASQPEVDRRRVGLLGHSEGGITAVIAAALASGDISFIIAEDTVAGPVYQSDLYRVNRSIRRTGFKPEEISEAMSVYGAFVDVARGLKSYSELEDDKDRFGDTEWFQWLAIPPRDAALWPTLPQRENLDTLVFWRKCQRPCPPRVRREVSEIAPVDQSIEAIGDERRQRAGFLYRRNCAGSSTCNLTIQPAAGEPFFWWKAAPGIVDLAVRWVRAQPAH